MLEQFPVWEEAELASRPDARKLLVHEGEGISVPSYLYVYERAIGPFARRRLIFESFCTVRCVASYPANWRELDDAQLLAVSDRP